MSTLKVNTILPKSGTSVTLGESGKTITIPSGTTIANSGTATGFGGTNKPYFMAVNTSNFSIANGTDTKVIFDTEISDSDSAYDTSTGRFTVPSGKGGQYYLHTKIRWNETADWDSCEVYFHVSGANKNYMASYWNNFNYTTTNASGILPLSAGDYVEILVYQGSGSAKNIRYVVFDGFKLVEWV